MHVDQLLAGRPTMWDSQLIPTSPRRALLLVYTVHAGAKQRKTLPPRDLSKHVALNNYLCGNSRLWKQYKCEQLLKYIFKIQDVIRILDENLVMKFNIFSLRIYLQPLGFQTHKIIVYL